MLEQVYACLLILVHFSAYSKTNVVLNPMSTNWPFNILEVQNVTFQNEIHHCPLLQKGYKTTLCLPYGFDMMVCHKRSSLLVGMSTFGSWSVNTSRLLYPSGISSIGIEGSYCQSGIAHFEAGRISNRWQVLEKGIQVCEEIWKLIVMKDCLPRQCIIFTPTWMYAGVPKKASVEPFR